MLSGDRQEFGLPITKLGNIQGEVADIFILRLLCQLKAFVSLLEERFGFGR
jgi:hypothetical protein